MDFNLGLQEKVLSFRTLLLVRVVYYRCETRKGVNLQAIISRMSQNLPRRCTHMYAVKEGDYRQMRAASAMVPIG